MYKKAQIKKWDVTGDNGLSKRSLLLLRFFTTSFMLLVIGFLVIVSGIIDFSTLPVRLQTLQIVLGVTFCVLTIPSGFIISSHPKVNIPDKIIIGIWIIGLLGHQLVSNTGFGFKSLQLPWDLNSFLLFPGLPMIAASFVLIPITIASWTMKPT